MNMKSKLVLLILTFLLFASFASANFGVYSETNILKGCQCSIFEDSIKIKNTGSQTTTYTLTPNFDFVNIEPATFELLSGEIQDVSIMVDAPCKILDKDLKIKVTSTVGDNYNIVKQLLTGKCQNLDVKLYADKAEINPCEELEYELLIENLGSFTETYSISSNYDVFWDLEETDVEIASESSEIVPVTITPACDVYGNTTVEFVVVAKNNNLQTILQHNVAINKNYDYTVSIDESIKLCEESPENFEIEIENEVDVSNNYNLKLIGAPSFVKLSSKNLSLEGEATGIVNLELNVQEGKHIGFYEFSLQTTSEYGDISKENNISLNISDCYNLDIEILNKGKSFCFREGKLNVNVTNLGTMKEEISLGAYPNFAVFETDVVSLESGESQEVGLNILSDNIDNNYAIDVWAFLDNQVTAGDQTIIKMQSLETCHYVATDKLTYSLRRHKHNKTEIKFTNKGKTAETYTLSLEPVFWLTLNETSIILEPGQTKNLQLLSNHTDLTEFGVYPFNLTITLGDIEYVKFLTLELKDKPICEKTYIYFSDKPCQAATVILIIAIIVFLILALALKKRKGAIKKVSFITITAIMVALLIVFGALVCYYEGPPLLNEPIDYTETNATHHIWRQDASYQLDLSAFVEDPDSGDELTISVLNGEIGNISVIVDHETIMFTPVEGWYGTEKIVLIATDSLGLSAESPEITLEVVKRNYYSLFDIYKKLCWFFNWVLLLIAFIFLFVLSFKKMRHKQPVLHRKVKKRR